MLKNKFKYLLLLVLVGGIAVLYNIYYTAIIFVTLCILPILLFAVLFYCKLKITVELSGVVHTVNKGDKIPVSVHLNNTTVFPVATVKIFLSYKNDYSDKKFKKNFLIPIDSNANTSVICTLYSECAGNLTVSLESIRIYDYFKIFSLKKKSNKEIKVAVLPNYYELPEFNANKNALIVESDSYHPTKKGDDPSEVFEIREYREGDRPQRIHWKLSRKVDQLMIKEFSYPLNSSILLFVNLCIPKGEYKLYYMDAILECALSLSYTLVMKQQVHYICWTDEKSGMCTRIRITQEEDLFEAVNDLLHANPYQNTFDMFSSYLSQYPHEQYADTYFITGVISDLWTSSIGALKTQSRKLIYIRGKEEKIIDPVKQEALHQFEEIGVETWPIDIGSIKQNMEYLSLG